MLEMTMFQDLKQVPAIFSSSIGSTSGAISAQGAWIAFLTFMAPLEYSFLYLEKVPFRGFGTEDTAVNQ